VDGADWLRTQLTAFDCGACGRSYLPSNIKVLAQRDELFFVDLTCRGCGAQAVAIVTIEIDDAETPSIDVGDLAPLQDDVPVAPAVAGDDVLAMHEFLRDFDGDFHALFGASRHDGDR
jgi:hypothetical protein